MTVYSLKSVIVFQMLLELQKVCEGKFEVLRLEHMSRYTMHESGLTWAHILNTMQYQCLLFITRRGIFCSHISLVHVHVQYSTDHMVLPPGGCG